MKKLLYLTALMTGVSYGAFRSDYITGTSSMTTPAISVGVSSASIRIPEVYSSVKDPTGFVNRTSTLSFNDSNRTLTILGNHRIYINGVAYDKASGSSKQIADTTGMHYVYYDTNGTIAESTSFPGFDVPLVASIYWNATSVQGSVGDERHGIKMDAATHEFLHDTVGTRYESGLTGSFEATGATVTAGIIHDEDVDFSIPQQTRFSVYYKDGSADYKWIGSTMNYYLMNGTNLRYNNGNSLADVAAQSYMAVWLFATTSISTPVVSIIGQRTDITIADTRANNTYESLALGTLPFKEMKLLYRVILRNTGAPPTYVEAADYRSVSGVPSGTFVATAHNVLTGLNWSSAGHYFDSNLSLGNYGVSGSTGVFTSSVTSPGANISTVAFVSKIAFADGTTQTTAPGASGGVTVYPATSSIFGVAGTVASVSYGFTGDPNTGIMSAVADTLQTVTGGAITSSHTAAGEIIQPLQPAFSATWSEADGVNVTGDGTFVTHLFDVEIYDASSDFANSTFTAPVAGKYQFNVTVMLSGAGTSARYKYVYVKTSNRDYISRVYNTADNAGLTVSCLADMDAGDQAYVQVMATPGSKDVEYAGGAGYSTFNGTLVN